MAPGEALVTGWFGLRWAYLGHYGHSYSSFHIMLIHFVSLTFPDYPILPLYKMENCLDKTCKHENSFQSEKMWKVSTTSPHTALPCIKWKTIEKQWVPVGVWSLLSSILSWSARRRQWQWLLGKHWLPGDWDWDGLNITETCCVYIWWIDHTYIVYLYHMDCKILCMIVYECVQSYNRFTCFHHVCHVLQTMFSNFQFYSEEFLGLRKELAKFSRVHP